MTVSDEQLVRSVREGVGARPGAGLPVEQIVQRGRRRVAVRRGAAGAAVAVLAAGTAVALSVTGLPLPSSAPPARGPSITLTPDPSRTTALRPATDMYGLGDAAIVRAGLELSPDRLRWGVGHGYVEGYGRSTGSLEDVQVSTAGPGFMMSSAHLVSAADPGATGCSEVIVQPTECLREPQPDGAVLFELRIEGELAQYVLLHPSGFVRVDVMGPAPPEAGLQEPFEPPAPHLLRTLVLDPTLRW